MLNIAICDDDKTLLAINRDILQKYLNDRRIPGKVSSFENAEELLSAFGEKSKYDIYLLDIIMKGMDGIELGKKLRLTDTEGIIIYLSSSKDYAIDSFDANAFYYLTKPLDTNKLYETLDRAVAKLDTRRKVITVKIKSGLININLEDLYYVELSDRSVMYKCRGETYSGLKLTGSFKDAISDILSDERFVLCGASFAVNLQHIKMIHHDSLTLTTGESIHIPRGAVTILTEKWSAYWQSANR